MIIFCRHLNWIQSVGRFMCSHHCVSSSVTLLTTQIRSSPCSMKDWVAPWNPLHPPHFSCSPLRLFAQAVALKTAHSVWMFFSQARAAGYMFAFPPLSKATFTSGPEEKGTTVYESMQDTAASSTLKLSAHLVCASRRRLSRVLLFVYFLAKGTCIPLKLRWRSEFRWFWMNDKSLTGKDVWKDNETWSKLKIILGGKNRRITKGIISTL